MNILCMYLCAIISDYMNSKITKTEIGESKEYAFFTISIAIATVPVLHRLVEMTASPHPCQTGQQQTLI